MLIGLAVSSTLFCICCAKKKILHKYGKAVLFSLMSVFLGAKLFGMISKALINIYSGKSIGSLDSLTTSGIVYYGGLLGFVFTLWVICKLYNKDFDGISPLLSFTIPLFHFFGRIGCFFGGCCYGKLTSSFLSIPYRITENGEIQSRYPTQLLEAIFEFILFFGFFTAFKKNKHNLLRSYFLTYSVFRFFIEFLRGDAIRGVFAGVSFSQIISIAIIITIIILIKARKVKS